MSNPIPETTVSRFHGNFPKVIERSVALKMLDQTNPPTPEIPETRLLKAILITSIKDAIGQTELSGIPLYRQNALRRKYKQIAINFLMSEQVEPFSCSWICDQIDIDQKDIVLFLKKKKAI